MLAIMFPKGWVTFIRFLVWMQHCMPALLTDHDCLCCLGSLFLIGLTGIIVLNCLIKPLPWCLLAFIFKANPIESFLFIQSATILRFGYLKDSLRSCQSRRVIFNHEKVVTQAFQRWKLRDKGRLRATASGPRSARDRWGVDPADLWDWFLQLNVLWSHMDFEGPLHGLNGDKDKASWLLCCLKWWLAQGHREAPCGVLWWPPFPWSLQTKKISFIAPWLNHVIGSNLQALFPINCCWFPSTGVCVQCSKRPSPTNSLSSVFVNLTSNKHLSQGWRHKQTLVVVQRHPTTMCLEVVNRYRCSMTVTLN